MQIPHNTLNDSLILPQWSRRGRPVHLVDKQQTQLQDAAQEIGALREQWLRDGQDVVERGTIITGLIDTLPRAVSESWLVIEVRSAVEITRYGKLTLLGVLARDTQFEEKDPSRPRFFHGWGNYYRI